jgi:hypothetical protein
MMTASAFLCVSVMNISISSASSGIAASAVPMLPAPAYTKVSEQPATPLDLGNGKKAAARIIKLSAEKPCGKVDVDTLNVIDMYCATSKTHYAIVVMQDPYMTQQKVWEIAKSLKCS